MIRYTLKCANDHSFESWFKSADGYEVLLQAGQVSCPSCGSVDVVKSLMAPRVTTARAKAASAVENRAALSEQMTPPAPQNAPASSAASSADAPAQNAQSAQGSPQGAPNEGAEKAAEEAIARMRKQVEENSEYVGMEFSAKARAMHAGEAEAKPIYGEAKIDEAKALIEDGVPVLPLPFTPKRKMN